MIDRQFEHAVGTWLEAGSDRTPAAAVDAVLLAIKTTPQERDRSILRRLHVMSPTLRLAAVIALVAIAGAGVVAFIGGAAPPSPTSGPTPSPSSQPSNAAIDVMGWRPYTSARYGFQISYPPTWSRSESTHAWRFPDDVDWETPAVERFLGPDLRVTAWSVKVARGTSFNSWIEAYCPASTEPCTGIGDRAQVAKMDGHDGVIVPFSNDVQAFFLIDEHMYVVAAWRAGFQNYLEAFLKTVDLLPAGPAASDIDTTLWTSYASDRYGFGIGHPRDWSVIPADRDWAEPGDGMSTATEGFLSPDDDVLVSAWSAPLAADAPLEAWLQTYCEGTTAPCADIEGRTLTVSTGGSEEGILVPFYSDVQAFIRSGDRVFVVAVWRGSRDAEVTSYGGGERLLEAFVSTLSIEAG